MTGPFLAFGLVVIFTAIGCSVGSKRNFQQASIHRRLGEAYLGQNNPGKAMAEFQKGLRLLPKDPNLHHDMGLAFLFTKQFDKAEYYLLQTLKLSDSIPEAYNHLAVVYLNQHRPKEAIEQLEKALKRPRFTAVNKAYLNLARAYLDLGQQEKAIEAYETSIERNPNDIRAYLQLSDLRLKRQEFAKAGLLAQQALTFYPKSYFAWFRVGKAMMGQNKPRQAMEAFRNTRELAPSDSEETKTATYYLRLLGRR